MITCGDLLTSPETLDLHRAGSLPAGHLQRADLPVRGPDRPGLPPTDYAGFVTTSRPRGARRRRRPHRRVALLPRQPDAELRHRPHPDQQRGRLLASTPARTAPCPPGRWPSCRRRPVGLQLRAPAPRPSPRSATTPTPTRRGPARSPRAARSRRRCRRRASTSTSSPTRGTTPVRPDHLVPGGNDILRRSRTCSSPTTGCTTTATPSGFTERNYNLQQDNVENPDSVATATRRSATPRPGAFTGGAAVVPRPRQRQPDHAAGRHPRHHQPVPVPADRRCVLLAVHRRRARHEHRRPRVHPRDQQPDDRRTRRGHHLRAGRRDGRVLGRPGRGGVHVQPRLPDRRQPWAVGPYATGNKRAGIRDYAINKNPLNYGNYGFDSHRRRGPRRRRDLERRPVGGAARRWCKRWDAALPLRRQRARSSTAPRAPTAAAPSGRRTARATAAGSR